ncbi:MAG: hypothetical protein ACK57V_25335 [Pirellula sp.]
MKHSRMIESRSTVVFRRTGAVEFQTHGAPFQDNSIRGLPEGVRGNAENRYHRDGENGPTSSFFLNPRSGWLPLGYDMRIHVDPVFLGL